MINENKLTELKSRSSKIVQIMGNYMFQNLELQQSNYVSPFYKKCEIFYLQMQIGMPTYLIQDEYIKKIRNLMESNITDNDFINLIKNTNVNVYLDSKRWNWALILEIVENYLDKPQRLVEAIRSKFLKKVL